MNFDKLTDAELIQLLELEHEEEIYQRRQSLLDFSTDKNVNYTLLTKTRSELKYIDGKLLDGCYSGVVLEGSSRSGKTFACIDFIIYLCIHLHAENGCSIIILRETYAEFKDTLYEDFKRRLDYYELDNPFHRAKEVKSFKIGKSTIKFMGCDNIGRSHGAGSDYVFANEMMSISQEVFNQLEQRCRIMFFGDYNPSFTQHWVFESILKRLDVAFLRSTFKDNPHAAAKEVKKILGYEPWLPGSYEVTQDGLLLYNGEPIDEKNQPPDHPTNIEQGTADEFMWKCYGLGLRGAMKGVIFPRVNYISEPETPQGLYFSHGLDFGFTNDPSALVDFAMRGMDIYIRPRWYKPTRTSDEMHEALKFCKVRRSTPITCDSSDRHASEKGVLYMVNELFERGWDTRKVSKTKVVEYWLTDMKRFRINVILDLTTEHGRAMAKAIKTEFENYKWMEILGILTNQPIDGFDHFISAARYAHMARRQER
jgi:PBSX family phage terminase large subunit